MSGLKIVRYVAWIGVVLAGLGLAYVLLAPKDEPLLSGLNEPIKLGAPFELVDHNGAVITEKAFEGRPLAIFFGFTNCPEVCPTTLYELASWIEELGEEGADLQAFFVSIDPERDTPELMKEYVTSFTDRIIGITGDVEGIKKLLDSWHVFAQKVPLEDGDYTMDHTASVFLVKSNGEFKSTIAYGETRDAAIGKLKLLINN